MKIVADIHLHSHYSRATSKDLDLEHLSKWAQLKGVNVVGCGDIAHPGWLQEMKKKLLPAEDGLFRLKDEYANAVQKEVPKACHGTVRFMLAGEISNIYKKNDKVRKIHNVVFLPTFEAVEKFQAELEKIGNIRSDGRPILGLDARDLLEIVLETDPQAYFIPAHIWTPWFSLFGSKSGFDSIEECFEDLTCHIFALETGLSSDPSMNWRWSALDRYTLVSNSDAHSPSKLAREANLFDTELSYPAIFEALKTGDPQSFLGTIEFFPEEGKYHFDGHRKCNISWSPETTQAYNGICSQCGKPVTIGVMNRVASLADRQEGEKPEHLQPFKNLIPLPEILSEVHQVGAASKRVKQHYLQLLSKLGPELSILQQLPLEEIKQNGGTRLADGIQRMRHGEVQISAGYDGEFGRIHLFNHQTDALLTNQLELFRILDDPKQKKQTKQAASNKTEKTIDSQKILKQLTIKKETVVAKEKTEIYSEKHHILSELNPQQRESVLCSRNNLIIVAGPGTGKTRTLTHRIAYLIMENKISPEKILAVTFTNKAAEEMIHRLRNILEGYSLRQIHIKTFHALATNLLREEGEQIGIDPNFSIATEDDQKQLLKQNYQHFKEKEISQYLEKISIAKNQLLTAESDLLIKQYHQLPEFIDIYHRYQKSLQANQMLDFDDLILSAIKLLDTEPEILQKYQQRFRWISVDEYQDINFAQYRFLRLLTTVETNLCIIGDPDQAIYGFRGADRAYFLRFQKDFLGAKTIRLTQNYRSTQHILNASRQVIAQELGREPIELWSDIVSKTRPGIYQSPTHKAEAEYVVHQIEKMVGGTSYFSLDSNRVDTEDEVNNRDFSEFAVLYRIGGQSSALLEAFQRSGIPYQCVGQKPFYEHKDVQEILTYLRFIYNPNSLFQLGKILNLQVSNQIEILLDEQQRSSWEGLRKFLQENLSLNFPRKRLEKMIPFLSRLKKDIELKPISNLIAQIDEFLLNEFSLSINKKRSELIQQLILKSTPFENHLKSFLDVSALQKEADEYQSRTDRVTLMTLHASKGLEFPVVFIVGCEEGLIPYQREGKTFDLEEERRLFYVGMTRAQQKLILVHANRRFLFGKSHQNTPSRFLSDIEYAIKEFKKPKIHKFPKKPKDDSQLRLF